MRGGVPGYNHQFQTTTDLDSESGQDVSEPVAGNGEAIQTRHDAAEPRRFYGLRSPVEGRRGASAKAAQRLAAICNVADELAPVPSTGARTPTCRFRTA